VGWLEAPAIPEYTPSSHGLSLLHHPIAPAGADITGFLPGVLSWEPLGYLGTFFPLLFQFWELTAPTRKLILTWGYGLNIVCPLQKTYIEI
jgi:hypothetical protein